MKEQDITMIGRLCNTFDKTGLFAYLYALKSRVSLDVAAAYNKGVEVGRKEGRENEN